MTKNFKACYLVENHLSLYLNASIYFFNIAKNQNLYISTKVKEINAYYIAFN